MVGGIKLAMQNVAFGEKDCVFSLANWLTRVLATGRLLESDCICRRISIL